MEFEGEGFDVGGGGEVEILHLLEGLPLVLDWGIRVLGVKAGFMVSVLLSRIKKKKKHKRNYLNYRNTDDNDNDSHSLLQILNFSNQDKKTTHFNTSSHN